MKGIDENTKRVVDLALLLGFTVSRTRNDHFKFLKPGCRPVFFSSTPGDHRACKNGQAKLRRAVRGL